MTRSDRLKPVARVSASREEKAARELVEAQQGLEAQMNQLEQLTAYRDEYRAAFQNGAAQGITGARLQSYRQFLAQLDAALEQQRRTVEAAQRVCQSRQQHWIAARGDSRRVEEVVAQARAAERAAEDRREQARSDEAAQRPHPQSRVPHEE